MTVADLPPGDLPLRLQVASLGKASVGVLVVDAQCRAVYLNDSAAAALAQPSSDLLGRCAIDLLPLEQRPRAWANFERALGGAPVLQAATQLQRADGAWLEVGYVLLPLVPKEGARWVLCLAARLNATDAERPPAARLLARLARERALRELLVSELHHRLKNTLQGVSGLLRAQLGAHPALREVLEDAIGRIGTAANVHGLVADQPEVSLAALVREVAEAVAEQRPEAAVRGEVGALDGVRVHEDELVPLGLCLNELVVNALKHGHGEAWLTGRWEGGEAIIEISNAGALPPQFCLTRGLGLGRGLRLVRSLLPRVGAHLAVTAEPGTNRVSARLVLSAPVVLAPSYRRGGQPRPDAVD